MDINHIGYLVKNTEKAIEEFEKLGYHVTKETMYDEIRKLNITFMHNECIKVELIEDKSKNSDSAIGNLGKKIGVSPYHICYIAQGSLDEQIKELITNKYVLIEKPDIAPALDGKKVVFLYNKYVGLIEVVEA